MTQNTRFHISRGFIFLVFLTSTLISVGEENKTKVIVDIFYPKTTGIRGNDVDVVDAEQSRRFYEIWGKKTYLIKDTIVLSGAEALKLFGEIKFRTNDKDPGTGWSGHTPTHAVTFFFDDKKSFVTTFCFESKSWIRRENGQPLRAAITKPAELKKLLLALNQQEANKAKASK